MDARSATAAAPGARKYARHRPEDTLLYDVVRDHLDEFLEHTREHGGRPLPRYVAQEFRGYLECGMLEHG